MRGHGAVTLRLCHPARTPCLLGRVVLCLPDATHDALDAADEHSTSPAEIVHIQRAWLTNPHAALKTQRQQFKTAMVVLEAGDVRTISSCKFSVCVRACCSLVLAYEKVD
jgi:hypothetical protein